ncbi:EAL domain-containing protein, partial [Aeromonas veronii]
TQEAIVDHRTIVSFFTCQLVWVNRYLAEGIETREEMACLREMGINLMQGYLFARPGFENLPEVDFASL